MNSHTARSLSWSQSIILLQNPIPAIPLRRLEPTLLDMPNNPRRRLVHPRPAISGTHHFLLHHRTAEIIGIIPRQLISDMLHFS